MAIWKMRNAKKLKKNTNPLNISRPFSIELCIQVKY